MTGRIRTRLRATENVLSLAVWLFAFWVLLTWTPTAEQFIFGAVLALLSAIAIAPLGPVVGPWRAAQPYRLRALVVLVANAAVRIVRANLSLTRRIWTAPRPPSGMVIVPSRARSDGEIASTGLITSLIVDNQVIDLDRERRELQYHAIEVPEGTDDERAEHVNAPIERMILRFRRRS
jgi:multicomponent Na+:H+ antiporter subunit E